MLYLEWLLYLDCKWYYSLFIYFIENEIIKCLKYYSGVSDSSKSLSNSTMIYI